MQTLINYDSNHVETISPDLSGLRTTWFKEYQYTFLPSSWLIFQRENLVLSKPECHHGIRTLTYLEAKSLLKVNKKPRK